MIKLIVEGQQIDLFKNEVFAITKAVAKIGDINLRHGDVSVSFKVPSTSKNNLIFRYIANLNNNNTGAFKRFEGSVLDGDSVISRGYFQVLKTRPLKKEIELRFYGGNSDWFELIKDRSINKTYTNTSNDPNSNSYDLSYMDHAFTVADIVSSWGNQDEYTYYPIDNGSNSDKVDNTFSRDDFQLGVFQHTIMDNIFKSVNIKLAGTLLNDPLYYNNLVTLPSDILKIEALNSRKGFSTVGGNIVDKVNYQPINFNTNDDDTQWSGSKFTSNQTADSITFRFQLTGERGQQAGDEIDLKVVSTINSISQPDIFQLLNVRDSSPGNNTFLVLDSYEVTFNNIKAGDEVEFLIRENNGGIDDWVTRDSVGWYGNFGNDWYRSGLSYSIVNGVTKYSIVDVVPEINQAKFVRDVMFRFGCISQYDSENRTLSIDKFETIEKNKNKGVDFTKKVDLSKGVDIDFTSLIQNYFKTTYIDYLEDDKDLINIINKEVFKIGIGNGEIKIDNDNLTSEGSIYTSVFAGTSQMWSFPFVGAFETSNFYIPTMSLFNGSGEVNELKPRILVNAGSIPVSHFNKNSYTEIDLEGSIESNVGYAYFAKQSPAELEGIEGGLNSNFDTLAFQNYDGQGSLYNGNTLLDKYYGLQSRILNNPIFLSINLNLKDIDIEKIDFLTPIWLETQLDSGYYYINEISQYKGDGSTTRVNLVKI